MSVLGFGRAMENILHNRNSRISELEQDIQKLKKGFSAALDRECRLISELSDSHHEIRSLIKVIEFTDSALRDCVCGENNPEYARAELRLAVKNAKNIIGTK